MFWLVQRLTVKVNPTDEPSPISPQKAGNGYFDDKFGLDYMGATEFEFGVAPALREIRTFDLAIHSIEITRGDVTRTVYFVASGDPEAYADTGAKSFEEVIEKFRRWFSADWPRSKEFTNFEEYFSGERTVEDRWAIQAWWSLQDNIAWTLDQKVAELLLKAFTNPDG